MFRRKLVEQGLVNRETEGSILVVSVAQEITDVSPFNRHGVKMGWGIRRSNSGTKLYLMTGVRSLCFGEVFVGGGGLSQN